MLRLSTSVSFSDGKVNLVVVHSGGQNYSVFQKSREKQNQQNLFSKKSILFFSVTLKKIIEYI